MPWRVPGGEQRWFDIVVAPLTTGSPVGGAPATGAPAAGVSVIFAEVTRHKQLQQQLQEAQAELEAAYQEPHSTVEELETTNEELQSTNEELETMNEELQSTNEELRVRSDELNQLNAFLGSVFTSVPEAVAVLDDELRIPVWNASADEPARARHHLRRLGLPARRPRR